ncbi:hypothetical protein PV10_06289 [Exophiala mesophila]|uniref:DUF3752 domain-containing protein n=1 Tax=Exophiala mesophila TaxID=212818 RepID=A0A0D1WRK6_EXOME|nr:uncharacterized protein PV10_06289 [Exophiala mesophila]KIV91785.1 hypothetical protein PV10_06289 [Exophiala mesophila]
MPPPVGPQLPPELQKRKRDQNDDGSDSDSDSSSDSSTGPQPPSAAPAATAQKPQSPPPKKSRVIGPSLPSAFAAATSVDERPVSPAHNHEENKDSDDSDDSDDDDDFGPQLPSSSSSSYPTGGGDRHSQTQTPLTSTIKPTPAKRDEWMTLAPESGDWSQRVDPTKLKNRKFQTGRGAKGPSSSGASTGASADSWHETAEEKLERLRREAMGIHDSGAKGKGKRGDKVHGHGHGGQEDEATARRLREYNDKARGPALYNAHQKNQTELDDDPSARAFDREKDIAGGLQLNSTQRRDMVKKATDFSSRFSSARYL